MTKDDIKKALTCCSNPSISYCKDCPYANCGKFDCCNGKMCKDALDLIIEQEREIKRLKAEVKQAKIDALNELKKKTHNYYPSIDSYCVSQHIVLVRDINELIKEIENE